MFLIHTMGWIFNHSLPVSSMAVDYPLVLYDCHFEALSWQQEAEEVSHVLSVLQQHWTQSTVKAHILHGMIQGLEARGGMFNDMNRCLLFLVHIYHLLS